MRRLIVVLLMLSALGGAAVAAPGELVVTGTGHAAAPPAVVRLLVGVEAEGEDPDRVWQQVAAGSKALLDALGKLGLKDDEIGTAALALVPEWRPAGTGNGGERRRIFRGWQMFEVRSGRLAEAGRILRAAWKAGANRIDSIGFEVADPAALQREAAADAVRDALARARAMADAAACSPGPILEIRSETAGLPAPVGAMRTMAETVPVAVPGTISVTARATLRLAMRRSACGG